MSWKHTVLVVTGCALFGMLLGGGFGYAAGQMTPDFFRHLIPWRDVEPAGLATFLGATSGVLLGGGLGCFGILIQFATEFRRAGRPGSAGAGSDRP